MRAALGALALLLGCAPARVPSEAEAPARPRTTASAPEAGSTAPSALEPPERGPSPERTLTDVTTTRRADGLLVTRWVRPDPGVTAIALEFDAGRAEEGALRGASPWLAETLVARLTPALGAHGATLSVEPTLDGLTLRVDVSSERSAAALTVLEGGLAPPTPPELTRTRAAALARETRALAGLGATARAAALRELFELPTSRHPHADALADPSRLRALDAREVARWCAARLRPERARLTVVGDVPSSTLERWTVGAAAPVAAPHVAPAPLARTKLTVLVVDQPGATMAHALVAGLAPSATDPRAPLVAVAWTALGSQVPGARAFVEPFADGSSVVGLEAQAAPAAAVDFVSAVLGRAVELSSRTLDERSLQLARARASDDVLFELETPSRSRELLVTLTRLGVSPEGFDRMRETARETSARAVLTAMRSAGQPSALVVSVAGDAARLTPALRRHAEVLVLTAERDFAIVARLGHAPAGF
ncbi:MAG: insulinase family protein [Polyangiaceae bacterium]|nr:insulinase family protein [Polyangiaceae bacterium]